MGMYEVDYQTTQQQLGETNIGTPNGSLPEGLLLSDALEEYKLLKVRREKLITTQGNFIDEATKRFDELDTEKDGKLTKQELIDGTTSKDKQVAKVATVMLNNRELIAQDKENITTKDLADLNTQRAALGQERKVLGGLNNSKFDSTYNSANTNKNDDLTKSELDSSLKNGKLNSSQKDQVSYLLSNFEIIDSSTGKDGALSTQDVRTYSGDRLAKTANLQAWDDSLDSQRKKVWYETVKKPISVETQIPQAGASAGASIGGSVGALEGVARGAEGPARSKGDIGRAKPKQK